MAATSGTARRVARWPLGFVGGADEAIRYRLNAAHCETKAGATKTADLRNSYLEIARKWRELADGVEAYEHKMAGGLTPSEGVVIPLDLKRP